jgi:hypothetical protein
LVGTVSARDSFLLRIDPDVLDAVRRWAGDELRSVNGQIEYVLRQALRDTGRLGEGARGKRAPRSPRSEE